MTSRVGTGPHISPAWLTVLFIDRFYTWKTTSVARSVPNRNGFFCCGAVRSWRWRSCNHPLAAQLKQKFCLIWLTIFLLAVSRAQSALLCCCVLPAPTLFLFSLFLHSSSSSSTSLLNLSFPRLHPASALFSYSSVRILLRLIFLFPWHCPFWPIMDTKRARAVQTRAYPNYSYSFRVLKAPRECMTRVDRLKNVVHANKRANDCGQPAVRTQ